MDSSKIILAILLLFLVSCNSKQTPIGKDYLQISGVYPHLTTYNQPNDSLGKTEHRECGIGAVVPWAGELWYLTYPPHSRTGSNDKLYMVDENMHLTIRPESVGGTHASRMIHKESNQLIIGPYFIDSEANVRVADLFQLEGRLTATTRHLTDPENKVMFYEMEGQVYEVDVHTLHVNRLFEKPVPGWHGKGAYVGQGHFIVANNGEHQGHSRAYSKLLVGGEAKNWEEAGVLAEWDGKDWEIVERKPFTDVMGPGDIYGNANDSDPVWSMGWDKRSVILKLRDHGEWFTYRMPKGSHTFDPRHGWFTEWPRIREINASDMMMVMHGTMFRFPKHFSRTNSSGIRPLATHLRYIPDFTMWENRLILTADEASTLQNPIVGQPQSNLWFGTIDELSTFGPANGMGGIWVQDEVEPDVPSDPFLIHGYDQRVLHLSHNAGEKIIFTLEIDREGHNQWSVSNTIEVNEEGYAYYVLPPEIKGEWLRLKANRPCKASAYFHYYSLRKNRGNKEIFNGIANVDDPSTFYPAIIRPAGHNKSLQIVYPEKGLYKEADLNQSSTGLRYDQPLPSRTEEVLKLGALTEKPYELDEASIILTDYNGNKWRIPRSIPAYESLWQYGSGRTLREVQSERYLANFHGLFYEVPRAEGAGNHVPEYSQMKPVSRHNKKISDYCSWRGLLVISGTHDTANEDGQVFLDKDGAGLWFGMVDDIWKFGKPAGTGGPWKKTTVKAGVISDPYLMTGFDNKSVELSHEESLPIQFKIEVAINHFEWKHYKTIEVEAGETNTHTFPQGFHAHWVRISTNKDCTATAIFTYD